MNDLTEYLNALPERMRGGITRFRDNGVVPGTFLQAVLENDLVGAVGKADDENVTLLWHYANMLYNAFPARGLGCWGSPEAVQDWAAIGGLNGIERGPKTFSRADIGQERADRLASLVNRFGGEGEVVA